MKTEATPAKRDRSPARTAGWCVSIRDAGRHAEPNRSHHSTGKEIGGPRHQTDLRQGDEDTEGTQPVFEGIAAPDGRPIVVEGKRFWVHAVDKGAVEVREDGQLVPGNSGDIVID